jgi:pimeloyl-ACP methyl ester carboxylesterase
VLIPNGPYLLEDFENLALDRPVIAFDLRNRARSDRMTEASKLEQGLHHDVEELEAVRRQFGVDRIDVIGHSYVGVTVILYGMKYPTHPQEFCERFWSHFAADLRGERGGRVEDQMVAVRSRKRAELHEVLARVRLPLN